MTDMSILQMVEMTLDYLQNMCLNHERNNCEYCPLFNHKGECMLNSPPDDWEICDIIENIKNNRRHNSEE